MKVIATKTIEKNASEVWEVMGNQFAEVDLWSSNFMSSQGGGESNFEGMPHAYRITRTERGETIQELESFDPSAYSLSYRITKGAPPVAEAAYATWSLQDLGAGQSQVSMEFNLDPKAGLPEEMLAKIEMGLQAAASLLAEELKFYMENGQPHPNKVKMTS